MKTMRLRQQLIAYLDEKPRTTHEILEYINKRTKHGTTSHVLGNVLAKDQRFTKLGTTTRVDADRDVYHTYSVTIWGLSGKKYKNF